MTSRSVWKLLGKHRFSCYPGRPRNPRKRLSDASSTAKSGGGVSSAPLISLIIGSQIPILLLVAQISSWLLKLIFCNFTLRLAPR